MSVFIGFQEGLNENSDSGWKPNCIFKMKTNHSIWFRILFLLPEMLLHSTIHFYVRDNLSAKSVYLLHKQTSI